MSLHALFKPESIAVIGASGTAGKLGYVLTEMIMEFGYPGELYLINPKPEKIFGLNPYPTVLDIKAKIDLAIALVPAKLIPKVAADCGNAGIKALVIITSGFREIGEEGIRLQEELSDIGERFGMRIMGPNCEGFVNCYASLFATAFKTMFKDNTKSGPISIISQSGCVTGLAYKRIQERGIGISIAASVGNEVDLKAIDYFQYLAEEPNTKVIASFLEGIRDGQRFKEKMQSVTRSKPVVILKVGRSEASKAAAMSHTGSLVGRDEIISSVFKQCGIVRADTVDELIDMSLAFASQPVLRGKGIGIITTGGGLGVHAADMCAQSEFAVPPLSPDAEIRIEKLIGAYGSLRNPVDLGTGFSAENPAEVSEIMADEPGIDAIIFILTAFPKVAIAEHMLAAKKKLSKPVLLVSTAEKASGEVYDYFINNGFPVYSSPCRVANALRGMREYSRYLGKFDEKEF
jgi:acyl-CoA synthetase (NDP forming)